MSLNSCRRIPIKQRAYAFLWLLHHFLEDPEASKDFESEAPLVGFSLDRGDIEPMVDTEEELAWGKEMQAYRIEFLKKWRGEEGLPSTDSPGESPGARHIITFQPASLISPTGGTPLTKRQKIIDANFANATGADNGRGAKRRRLPGETGSYVAEATPKEGLQLSADGETRVSAPLPVRN